MKPTSSARVVVVVGTRPEAIKMAPVVRALRGRAIETLVVATAQHRELLDQALGLFDIVPDRDLELMRPDQPLSELAARVVEAVDATVRETAADLLLVQGDTTTAFGAALAAFHRRVPVGHVEAGLRSHDLGNPFPEEANRRLVDVLSALLLAPTPLARQNLLAEGALPSRIAVTGNTVVDALEWLLARPATSDPVAELGVGGGRLMLVTSHRRESWGLELESICLALRDLIDRFEDLEIVYPVHLNPNVRSTVERCLAGARRIHVVPPLDYRAFLGLLERAHLVLTDSGGVQEEAPSLGKPTLVLRAVTERPEAARLGLARVVGTRREDIVAAASKLLSDEAAVRAMTARSNPYGDGRAAGRVALAVERFLAGRTPLLEPGEEFGVEGRG